MGASMLAKVIVSMSKLLFTFVLFSHRQFEIFLLNAFIFLMKNKCTLCTIIICKPSNIAFFVHIPLISFCFQRCYFTKIQCIFFLSSTSWRLTRNRCLTRRIQMRDHHMISCCWEWRSWWQRRLLGFKRGWWKMIPLIVRPNPKLQFDTTHD